MVRVIANVRELLSVRCIVSACLAAVLMSAQAGFGQSKSKVSEKCFVIRAEIGVRDDEKRTRICKSDIDRLLRAQIEPPLEWPRLQSERRIDNCEEYLTTIGYEGYWSSRSDQAAEAPYMRTCALLVALRTAGHGRSLFKSASRAMSLASLPPTIAFHAATTAGVEELEQFAKQDMSARDLIAQKTFSRNNDISIRLLAVADVDGDGINDYIVERWYRCSGPCADSYQRVGYLSPRPGRRVMQWTPFDRNLIKLPNSAAESDAFLPALVAPSHSAPRRER